jgi:hypothetical protein
MRIALAIIAMLAFLPTAHSKESTVDKQFSHNAEFRVRYVFEDNQSGNAHVAPNNGSHIEQRLKLGGSYKVSEKFTATATFLHTANWGSTDLGVYGQDGKPGAFSSGDNVGEHNGLSPNNLLTVQEAYGTWLLTDDVLVRFGRAALTLGDGSVIAVNDYEPTPFSFDGILGTYEFEMGRLSAWVVKLSEYSTVAPNTTLTPSLATARAGTSDPDANAYGLSFDLKRMPEWLKLVNLHIIKNTKASTPGALYYAGGGSADPLSRMGQDTLRYGIALAGDVSFIDYKADFAGNTGKYKCLGSFANGCGASASNFTMNNLDTSSYMYQLEAGFNFRDIMRSRVFAKYHWDSGDSDTAANATKVGTYDPYFYDRYSGAGKMEIFNWGNLKYITVGTTSAVTDQTTVGAQYFYYQKSSKNGQLNAGKYGTMALATTTDSDALGSEFNVWSEHKYDGGFSLMGHLGYFLPGSSIKNSRVAAGGPLMKDSYTQVMIQGKMVF